MSKGKGSGNERDKVIKAVTDDLLMSRFTTELGQKARVERTEIENDERMDQLREVVADVGRDLLATGKVPKGMSYRGSLCVHVYSSEILKTAVFATTSNHETLTLDLADGALRELTGTTLSAYGKHRQKFRSGF